MQIYMIQAYCALISWHDKSNEHQYWWAESPKRMKNEWMKKSFPNLQSSEKIFKGRRMLFMKCEIWLFCVIKYFPYSKRLRVIFNGSCIIVNCWLNIYNYAHNSYISKTIKYGFWLTIKHWIHYFLKDVVS